MMTVKQLRDHLATLPDDVEVSFGSEHSSAELILWYKNGDRGRITDEGHFVPKMHIGFGKFITHKQMLREVTKLLQKK